MKTIIFYLSFILLVHSRLFALYPLNVSNVVDNAKKLQEKLKPIVIGSGEFSLSPFAFTENKGQVFGYDGLAHSEVKFVFQQAGTQIFLLEKGIAYQFTKVHYPEGYQELIQNKFVGRDMEKLHSMEKLIRTETYRMDMTLVGADKDAAITTEGKSADYTNFYTHNIIDVHNFSKVTYHNIYPGIDWVVYCKNNQIKYDFIVKPHADPSLIKMEFTYQEDLFLNKDGSFTLKNSIGSIIEKSPESFQNGKRIDSKFVLDGNRISFELKGYSSQQELTIDPAVVWGTYYGGAGADHVGFCNTDASGNIYFGGQTNSMTNIASVGHQNTFGGGFLDAFLVKFNASGLRQWGTYYGGSDGDYGSSCVSDGSGNIYLAGSTTSTSNISSNGHQNNFGGGLLTDAYLVKFNANGVRLWATYYGDIGVEYGYSCSTDGVGNAYLVASTSSTLNMASGGHQNTFGGGTYDALLVKFNGAGVRQWATYYGDQSADYGNTCISDISGNVYLAGSTSSSNNIAYSGYQNTIGGSSDAFISKFNSSGVLQWGTYYGGVGGDIGSSLAIDVSGNIYLAGISSSSTNIASAAHQTLYAGGLCDAFLVKFNSSGLRQWSTYYGDTGDDYGYSCATDPSGNVYLAGNTSSTVNIAFSGHQNTYGGDIRDAFLIKFNNNGIRLYGTYYGGSLPDQGASCATDGSGNVYLSGSTSSQNNIAFNGHQNAIGSANLDDTYLVKFCNNPLQPSSIIGNGATCFGTAQTFSVTNDPAANNYSWTYSGVWTGISSTNSISVVPLSSGTITVIAQNSCAASISQTFALTVSPLPTISVNNGSICAGQFFVINPNGAFTYTYSGGTNSVSPTTSTSYSISGTNSLGCVSATSAISNVTVFPTPQIIVNNGNICLGNSFTISPSGALSYTISGGSTIVSPITNSTYSVSGTNSSGCTSTLLAVSSVTVHPLPIVLINGTTSTICEGESITLNVTGASTYTWSNGFNGTSLTFSPNINSIYSVIGKDTNACVNSATVTQNVDPCVGLSFVENSITPFITLYPNPNSGLFILETQNECSIKIYNAIGQLLQQVKLIKGINNVDLGHLANGTYLIKTEGERKILKLLKE